MKRWPMVILVLLVVLGAVVPGCRHVVRYDRRLVAADSLMRTNPDSALSLLESLNYSPARGEVARSDGGGGTALATDGDRAYRDLLLTQARYKAYITATSDSDINRALAYFSAHPADREKLTRAYIYKGAVMDELGRPDSAMLYYKTAESTAAPDDYFNLGYCNLRIAELYQSRFINDSAVVARMKTAARYFMAANDTNFLIIAIGTQGAYPKILGEDSARLYLKRAILLSKNIHSSNGLQYQSKLAGRYFFCGDYIKAKELAMDIVKNDRRNECNEQQYYYYAARSFIRLNLLDSARWIISLTPAPENAVDSMNLYQFMAELSKASRRFDDYVRYNEAAREIDNRLMEASRNSRLVKTELEWNADQQEKKARSNAASRWGTIVGAILLGIVLLTVIAIRLYYRRIRYFRRRLDRISNELEQMLVETDNEKQILQTLQENYRRQANEKNQQLSQENKIRLELEQASINSQVSDIIRYRNAALNELYQNVRIKSAASDGRKRVLPLFGVMKELFENKGILNKPLPKAFWDNLRLSVDLEFQGIASFVERQYPQLSVRDLQLFMLLCADFPNQIIKICMNYTHDVTVSKSKKKLISDKIGLDVKFDEFIRLYLQGKLTNFS